MSKLNVDQKSVSGLFQDKKADFLIPDYQRPYAWQEVECQTLWDDIFSFAFPDNDVDKFNNESDEYFLGPIVTFKNDNGKLEIIDGQQRLTTLMLLLRAFYSKYDNMKDANSIETKKNISRCIWKTDEFGNANMNALKIDSEVATDNDKEEFLTILKTGEYDKKHKSTYAINYKFFQDKIDGFLSSYPGYFSYLPTRILNNCILLPIEADNQDTALRIFSTLNDRGKPLADADIFKAQLYKIYSERNKKDEFIEKWKKLEEVCENIFHPTSGTPMDELFTRYMYFERAKLGIKSSTTEALRKFYERDSYKILKEDGVYDKIIDLASFWNDINNQESERFSDRVLRRLFVLNYAPNGMWTYFVTVYYLQYKNLDGILDDDKFYQFLNVITAFIWAYAIFRPGVNALRTPVYTEMINIVNNEKVEFADFKFDEDNLRSMITNYGFFNARPITKSMLAWWAFNEDKQHLISLEKIYEIEHIYARNRYEKEESLSNPKLIELLGNKSLLEKKINIRASDYRFEDKVKYYNGTLITKKGKKKEGTEIYELINIAESNTDFNENDILQRNSKIINGFIQYLNNNDLLK